MLIKTESKTRMKQQTLKQEISISDIGLHSGEEIKMTFIPAEEDTGIVFVRTDLKEGENVIPALWHSVVDTRLCTVIANPFGASVGTIEHVMSALRGCGIDNLRIEINGGEAPIMDGSSMPFVKLIDEAGIQAQEKDRQLIRVRREVSVEYEGKKVTLKPHNTSSFAGEIEFDHEEIGRQIYETTLVNGNFRHEIANARTFGFFHEAEYLRSQGLARGGSLDNAIILNDEGVMNKDGLRFENEFIRHKLLDAIGDLYLAGGQILGHYDGIKAGHAINNDILKELFSDPRNWEYITHEELALTAQNAVEKQSESHDKREFEAA